MMHQMVLDIKPIPGFSNYFADNEGDIYSRRRRRSGNKKGEPILDKFGNDKFRILHQCCNGNGYRQVSVASSSGKSLTQRVTRLVASAFLGPCPDGMECCHKNGVRTDNNLENLKYATHSENLLDKRKHGTSPHGEVNGNSVLTKHDVLEIRKRYASGGVTQKELADEFGVSRSCIKNAISGRTWAHIY